jgi:hypothetical protein
VERNSAANLRSRGFILAILVIALLAGLPIAAWLDLSDLTDRALHRQAADLNSVITSMRSYYASNVVGRILASSGSTEVAHNYQSIPGAVPIPATLSLELGRVISEQQHNIIYRFISDYPFENRAPHVFDDFERRALDCIKQNDTIDSDRRLGAGRLPPPEATLRPLPSHQTGLPRARGDSDALGGRFPRGRLLLAPEHHRDASLGGCRYCRWRRRRRRSPGGSGLARRVAQGGGQPSQCS